MAFLAERKRIGEPLANAARNGSRGDRSETEMRRQAATSGRLPARWQRARTSAAPSRKNVSRSSRARGCAGGNVRLGLAPNSPGCGRSSTAPSAAAKRNKQRMLVRGDRQFPPSVEIRREGPVCRAAAAARFGGLFRTDRRRVVHDNRGQTRVLRVPTAAGDRAEFRRDRTTRSRQRRRPGSHGRALVSHRRLRRAAHDEARSALAQLGVECLNRRTKKCRSPRRSLQTRA